MHVPSVELSGRSSRVDRLECCEWGNLLQISIGRNIPLFCRGSPRWTVAVFMLKHHTRTGGSKLLGSGSLSSSNSYSLCSQYVCRDTLVSPSFIMLGILSPEGDRFASAASRGGLCRTRVCQGDRQFLSLKIAGDSFQAVVCRHILKWLETETIESTALTRGQPQDH